MKPSAFSSIGVAPAAKFAIVDAFPLQSVEAVSLRRTRSTCVRGITYQIKVREVKSVEIIVYRMFWTFKIRGFAGVKANLQRFEFGLEGSGRLESELMLRDLLFPTSCFTWVAIFISFNDSLSRSFISWAWSWLPSHCTFLCAVEICILFEAFIRTFVDMRWSIGWHIIDV